MKNKKEKACLEVQRELKKTINKYEFKSFNDIENKNNLKFTIENIFSKYVGPNFLNKAEVSVKSDKFDQSIVHIDFVDKESGEIIEDIDELINSFYPSQYLTLNINLNKDEN